MAKNKKGNKELTFKEIVKLNFKAFKLYYNSSPKLFHTIAFSEILKALTPYVAIFISAQIIGELSGEKNATTLWMWVVISLVSAAVLMLLNALVLRRKNIYGEEMENMFLPEDIYRKKRMSMDFCVTDSKKTRDLHSQISQNSQFGNWGLPYIATVIFPRIISSTTSCIIAFLLTINLFILQATHENYLFLNSPVTIIVVIALITGIAIFASLFDTLAISKIAGLADSIKFGNRCFGFFSGTLYDDKSRALDLRIYNQHILSEHYVKNIKIFTPGSEFAKLTKKSIGICMAIAEALQAASTGIIYIFVALKALAGAFGVGAAVQYIASAIKLTGSVKTLITVYGVMKSNAAFLQICFEFLQTPNVMYQGSLTTEKRNDNNYEIEFKNVSFKYPDTDNYVLENISFKFAIGKRLAVVGENGSGKTTFIKLLCRLYEPTQGEILLNGIDIKKYNYSDYLNVFSVVFQDFKLLSYSLAQNVAASVNYDEERVKNCLEQAGFNERLDKMKDGINTPLYKDLSDKGIEISGGESQKIAIARAIYKNSPFVILDEPTAALDPIAEAEVYSKFNEIMQGKTAICISHRLSSCKFCDEIVVFDSGKVVQKGTHEQLLNTEGKYKALWFAQAQYYTQTTH